MTDLATVQHKISQGRTRILLRDPFFATILMDMDPVIDASVTENCATNGERIFFNPQWVVEADPKEIAAGMRKMALHVALSHPLRRGTWRKPDRWRAACDQAAWHIMQNEGVELPIGGSPNPMFDGMTADEIYRLLEEQENQNDDDQDDDCQNPGQQPQGGAGDGQGDDQGQDGGQGNGQGQAPVGQAHDGADMSNPAEVSQKQAENDQRTVRAAMAAKAAGSKLQLADELVEQIKAKGVDWRDRLHAFIDDKAEVRLSWSKPNRRFVGEDMYLPGKAANGIDTLAFVVDTSSSMNNDELAMCVTQIEAARESIGIKTVVVIECSTSVGAVLEFDMSEPLPTEMKFTHRGGTSMQPGFDKAMEFDPTAIVCLTDAEFGGDMQNDPGVPALFAITHAGAQGRTPATFGDYVDLPDPKAA